MLFNSLLSFMVTIIIYGGPTAPGNNFQEKVGGPCEGCEAIYEYGSRTLKAVDTFPGFKKRPEPIRISGTVYLRDGKTPAKDVILYIYHTDERGIYPSTSASQGWERRHGTIRGWLKTDKNGSYTFYSSRPASYPNSTIPQHIHITVKEPGLNEYYVEDFYFKDDPHITKNILVRKHPRGGSGVIQLQSEGDLQVAYRNIILGYNIPNYPD
ncbi:MAG: intradiol ring-cleavage dioxygenase [Bacteroidia bacterium]|nr:intradiol ring-cleavage dioxygenase [Bacteroidia bacterium]NND25446.1 intradiol ring-cleavage dioxygenase [Flavobacteriaceae bacterium]MBT8278942.1 intradiol ring-cleavage dioxygenase [Bacteroidia bacterium]NNK60616.1 intradiol ring-cleavage dioxygenase [Flavobacteriaceae bacterium]NNL32166.1 intradiol ring-cleavage dioxygenase [Flavobacteriaceae bacterium]